MKRILSIDYGDVRVGLAISDALGITAQGIDNLVINKSDKNFLKGIKEIIQKYDVTTVVMGYPKNMDGSESEKTRKVDSLIPLIENLNVKVHKWDERLTTVSAYKTMRQMDISQKQKNKYADRLAAVYILEGYLNYISNQNEE